MKKLNILLSLLISSLFATAQETELKEKFILETIVEAPLFIGNVNMDKSNMKPFIQFLQEELAYLSKLDHPDKEGIVSVNFTINNDGSLSNIHIENSISKTVDQAVLHAVENSNNKWLAGKINGKEAAMDQSVYVKFDIPGNPNHLQMAQTHLNLAFNQIKNIKHLSDKNLDSETLQTKTQRKAKIASSHLANAQKYKPNDMSITFWQAHIYEIQGENELLRKSLNKYIELAEYQNLNQKLENNINLAVITLK